MTKTRSRTVGVILTLCLLLSSLSAQRFRGFGASEIPSDWFAPDARGEFHFARLVYSGWGGRRGGSWATDYPDAEYHFMQGVRRLTSIDSARGGKTFRPDDEDLFDYPWLYAVEVGRWDVSEEDGERLREYLLRGGFLVVDDFHGTYQWAAFLEGIRKVFPGRPIN